VLEARESKIAHASERKLIPDLTPEGNREGRVRKIKFRSEEKKPDPCGE